MKIKKKTSLIVLLLITIPSLFFNFQYIRVKAKLNEINTVTSVVDGDTLVLKSGQRIRLMNLTAPEHEFCGGVEAKNRLQSLVLGKTVKIETNAEDVYNRTLGLVYVDSLLVNDVLLKEGLVRYDGSPSSKRDKLKASFDEAVENKRGIHGPPCRSENPDKPKCTIKGNISRSTEEKYYYFQGCQSYPSVMVEKDLGESWFCTEKEAESAGYKIGPNCPKN